MIIAKEYHPNLSIRNRCNLLEINRSNCYYNSVSKGLFHAGSYISDSDLANEIQDIWSSHPFLGYRKITVMLQRDKGYNINHKKVLRLMQDMSIKAIYCNKKNTTIINDNHYKYPYLLKDITIDKPNHVWQTDITYIKLPQGFVYLAALLDVYSRFIVSWKISNNMETDFCLDVLHKALNISIPEIINTDQGSQFTSSNWCDFVRGNNIKISMDGKGRWADNIFVERLWRTIKYEEIYINPPDNIKHLRSNLTKFIMFYNHQRPHQNLAYSTPAEIFFKNVNDNHINNHNSII